MAHVKIIVMIMRADFVIFIKPTFIHEFSVNFGKINKEDIDEIGGEI